MSSLQRKIGLDLRAREMLEEQGHPAPDRVEYGYGCIRFFFDEPKLVVVIDIDIDNPEVDRRLGIKWPVEQEDDDS